jgi:hypothetical protein
MTHVITKEKSKIYINSDYNKVNYNVKNKTLAEDFKNGEHSKSEDILIIEQNSDSNKSQNNFLTSMVNSITGSIKDEAYLTPKSMHNLNLLFTESNGKRLNNQKTILNNVK